MHIFHYFGYTLVALVLQKALVEVKLGIFFYLHAYVIELFYGRVASHKVLRAGAERDYFQIFKPNQRAGNGDKFVHHIGALFRGAYRIFGYVCFYAAQF